MSDVIKELYSVILSRRGLREAPDENSYTAYLFREGIDKILKKVGEESAETIIAAKSFQSASASLGEGGAEASAREDLVNEVSDLLYHVLVLLAERGVEWTEVEDILAKRAGRSGNLKPSRGN
jgi:phosphoribosyl-ATP pyrophosphohydrolase